MLLPEEGQFGRLRVTTVWLTGSFAALALVLLLWLWLSRSGRLSGAWTAAAVVFMLLCVALVVRAALRVLTPGVDFLQDLAEDAKADPPRRPRGLWKRLDRETSSRVDIPDTTFLGFLEKRQEILTKVKARLDQEDAVEDERLRGQERRYALAGEQLLAAGNLWLARSSFRVFIQQLGIVGLGATLLTVALVAFASSGPSRASGPRAEGKGTITSPTAVLVYASSPALHRRLFGNDCPATGVRGMAIAGSLDAPEVLTYGTEQCRATRILVDGSVGVAVPVDRATANQSGGSTGDLGIAGQGGGGGGGGFSGGGGADPTGGRSSGSQQPTPTEGPRVRAVAAMAGGSAAVLAGSVLADLSTKAGEEAITTVAQLRRFAIEQAAGPFTKKLSEGLAQGLADKANNLWGTDRQASQNAADRARVQAYQTLVVELGDGLAQGRLASIVPRDQREAIARAIAKELADRLAAQMRARVRGVPPKPFTG